MGDSGNTDEKKNIVIVGGGIIGSSAAYFLTRHSLYNPAQHKITLLEATSIASAASGKAGGLLALWAYPKSLVPLSFRLHKELADEHGGKDRWGYRPVGVGAIELEGRKVDKNSIRASAKEGDKKPISTTHKGDEALPIGEADSTAGTNNVSLEKELGFDKKQLQQRGLPDDLDWVANECVQGYQSMGSHKDTAQVHPYQFTTSMAELAAEKGVNIVLGKCEQVVVEGGVAKAVKYSTKATGETETIEDVTDVIVTAGPWSKKVDLPKNFKEGSKSKAMSVTPEIYARPNNELYACGEGDHQVPLPETSAEVEVDDKRCQDIVDYCASFSDEMRDGEVLVKQACYLPQVEYGNGPLIGRTRTKGVWLAAGHTCWGIQNGPATGKLMNNPHPSVTAEATFPVSNSPRVWVISSADTPVGISLLRRILTHGDFLVAGIDQAAFESNAPKSKGFKEVLTEIAHYPSRKDWQTRLKVVSLDLASTAQCQAAIATGISAWGKVDILFCCTSTTVLGAVEELAAPEHAGLVRNQFETNFYGPVNLIRATISDMRRQTHGHIIVLTGISGHLGTPGLGVYCSSQWALEGFCDSIAYEVAPFGIKVTVVQSSVEIGILTNVVTAAPAMPEYMSGDREDGTHGAPLFRGILEGILNRLPGTKVHHSEPEAETDNAMSQRGENADTSPSKTSESGRTSGSINFTTSTTTVSLFPPLSCAHTERLVAETVHAITAIGGHENPPARHIVGIEGVASVKEKLKTVSEELEEFVDTSTSADCDRVGDKRRRGDDAEVGGGARTNGAGHDQSWDEHVQSMHAAARVLQSI
ncbi:hypothetical protein LTR64_007320 [Lithohypha guttulata]|uniref:uncharacterized protein n=1 Tax=Lithohypha guttulata TaxID=1690604 RepID=UPI002DE0D408|nr:hypothetical protein LTR51_004123 [Lithohypha guttulata]